MKTRGQKIADLIDALDNGNVLYKEHGDPFYSNKEFLIKDGDQYMIKGFASAYNSAKDRLFEIIHNPDEWKLFPNFNIHTNGYPYPWSSTWQTKN